MKYSMRGRHPFCAGLVAIAAALSPLSCGSSDSTAPTVEEQDSGISPEQDATLEDQAVADQSVADQSVADQSVADQSTIDSAKEAAVDSASSPDSSTDSSLVDPPDGPPSRKTCISSGFGTLPSSSWDETKQQYRYGRMDGFLIAIVPPSKKNTCKADTDHLHLQVLMNGQVFDVAVNVDDEGSSAGAGIYYTTVDSTIPGGTWKEGYNTWARLDYTVHLGLHADAFQKFTTSQLKEKLMTELESANHITIYMTPYPDGDGGHLVHYNGPKYDGAIAINPLKAKAHVLAFRFADKEF